AGRRALRPGGPAPALRAGRGGHRGLAVRLLPDDRRRGLVAAGPRGGGRPGHPLLHVRSAGRVRLRAVPAPGALHRLLAGLHLRRADRRLDRAAAVHRPARHLPLLGSAGRLHRPHRRAQRPGPVAGPRRRPRRRRRGGARTRRDAGRSEEHTSALQSRENHVCRLLLEKKKYITIGFDGTVLYLVLGCALTWHTAIGFLIGPVLSGKAGYVVMHVYLGTDEPNALDRYST